MDSQLDFFLSIVQPRFTECPDNIKKGTPEEKQRWIIDELRRVYLTAYSLHVPLAPIEAESKWYSEEYKKSNSWATEKPKSKTNIDYEEYNGH